MIEVIVSLAVLIILAGMVRRYWAQIIAFVVLSGIFAIAVTVYLVMQEMRGMTQ